MKKDGWRINHLLFINDLKLFAKNEKEIDSLAQTVRVYSEDIGIQFGVEKRGFHGYVSRAQDGLLRIAKKMVHSMPAGSSRYTTEGATSLPLVEWLRQLQRL